MNPKAYSYIRFSTPEQLKGDSLHRQLEASEKYAKENNLQIDTKLNLQDLGLSAFHGTHRTNGALGQFLQLIETGKIDKGSILIVENLDRLSREQVLDALNQFTSIIQAGIKIVTLQDGAEYTKASISQNWTQLIVSITYMARAHEESLTKSKRLKKAWEAKRDAIRSSNKKLTARTPSWIKLSDDKTNFTLIPEISKAIELIFQMKLNGKGSERIAKELNTDNKIWKPIKSNRNKLGGWRKSYINKILTNRAIIGEFQPHSYFEDNEGILRRQAVGNVVKNYFPLAIDTNLFYEVQNLIQRNSKQGKHHSGGKTGKATNLFVHLAKCGLCGSPMHFIDKGKPPKGGKYLHCDNSRRLKLCSAKAIQYYEFENLFFENFEELEISQLIPSENKSKAKINKLTKLLSSNEFKINEVKEEFQNLFDSLKRTNDKGMRDIYEKELISVRNLIEELQQKNTQIEKEIYELKNHEDNTQNSIEDVKEFYQLYKSITDEKKQIELRLKLRIEIQKLVEWIKIYPLQEKYQEYTEVEQGVYKVMNSKYIDRIRIKFKGSDKKLRVLLIKSYMEQIAID